MPFFENEVDLSDRMRFVLAESLFQLERIDEARPIYHKSLKTERYEHHSRYRLAQIARLMGQPLKAVEFISEIADSKKDTLWKELAKREMKFDELSKQL